MRHVRRINLRRLSLPLIFGVAVSVGVSWGAQEAAPPPRSKKGLQVQMVDDALALGIAHAALNVQLGDLVQRAAAGAGGDEVAPGWVILDSAYQRLDAEIGPLAAAGVELNLILLARATGDAELDALLLDPRYDASAPNRLGAFRALDEPGRTVLGAVIRSLSRRYAPGSARGHVRGWIVGNEVNSHWWWYNLGRATVDEVARSYEAAVRVVHDSVRATDPDARVYVSLEHHWGARFGAGDERQACPGRTLLDTFAALVRENGDLPWHIAFHPYPEDLFDCRFWLDESAHSTPETPRITFKNLQVLTTYLQRDELRYAGRARRVILSEQGFHCPDGADGPRLQAEAFARAWRIVDSLEGVDAFIYHRHVDHAHEGGLRFGLWTNAPGTVFTPGERRPLWELFRVCDTPDGPAALARAAGESVSPNK